MHSLGMKVSYIRNAFQGQASFQTFHFDSKKSANFFSRGCYGPLISKDCPPDWHVPVCSCLWQDKNFGLRPSDKLNALSGILGWKIRDELIFLSKYDSWLIKMTILKNIRNKYNVKNIDMVYINWSIYKKK